MTDTKNQTESKKKFFLWIGIFHQLLDNSNNILVSFHGFLFIIAYLYGRREALLEICLEVSMRYFQD